MPYISPQHRDIIDSQLDEFEHPLPMQYPLSSLNAGALNYVITKLLRLWLGPTLSYERMNAAIGVLEAAKLEMYRRVVAPYEYVKMKENGDVW